MIAGSNICIQTRSRERKICSCCRNTSTNKIKEALIISVLHSCNFFTRLHQTESISSSADSSTCIFVSPSASAIIGQRRPRRPQQLAHDIFPEPSVLSSWFALPSAVGNVNAELKRTAPPEVTCNLFKHLHNRSVRLHLHH